MNPPPLRLREQEKCAKKRFLGILPAPDPGNILRGRRCIHEGKGGGRCDRHSSLRRSGDRSEPYPAAGGHLHPVPHSRRSGGGGNGSSAACPFRTGSGGDPGHLRHPLQHHPAAGPGAGRRQAGTDTPHSPFLLRLPCFWRSLSPHLPGIPVLPPPCGS